jgi:hypothetical protein
MNQVTTLAYDIAVELCDPTTTGCTASAGPSSLGTNISTGTATFKFFVMQDVNGDSAITTADAVFVDAATGSDGNPGTSRSAPKQSLASAMTAASGGKAVYIIAGNYCASGYYTSSTPPCSPTTGTLNVPSGTSIYGGFTSAWYRPDVSTNRANIIAGSNASADSIGISLGAVNVPVRIEGLDLTTQAPTPYVTTGYNAIGLRATSGTSTLTLYKNKITTQGAGSSSGAGQNPGGSYGVYVSNLNTLEMLHNSISAGKGWDGANGSVGGANGAPGLSGGNGAPGIQGSVCWPPCNDDHGHAAGGYAGAGGVPGYNDGGAGGIGGWQDDGPGNCGARGGCDGANAPNGGGTGGARGTSDCNGHGSGGNMAGVAASGSNGLSPGSNYGQIVGGFVRAYQGNSGTDGAHGMGGGGGGGGAGAECFLNDSGGGGGGGGGGGARGTGGEGGWGGGPSIGVYIDTVSSVTLTSNSITRGSGGAGGNGKNGGTGGPGGAGGIGGDGPDNGGDGGNGAPGRPGGNGGHGSGGNGGPSYGLTFVSSGAPTCSGNTYAGGGGGAAGTSAGNNGSMGHNANCFQFTPTLGNCTCN